MNNRLLYSWLTGPHRNSHGGHQRKTTQSCQNHGRVGVVATGNRKEKVEGQGGINQKTNRGGVQTEDDKYGEKIAKGQYFTGGCLGGVHQRWQICLDERPDEEGRGKKQGPSLSDPPHHIQIVPIPIFSVVLPSGSRVSLLDTIGFITNLPVEMVECFKATLE